MTAQTMKLRVDVLGTIAERYQELVEPAGRSGEPGNGEHVPLMPRTYTATVQKFEVLYRECPARPFVLGWFMGPTRIALGCPECGKVTEHKCVHGPRSKPVKIDPAPIVVKARRGSASMAESGILWMAESWRWRFEPMLPDEILAL